MKKKLLFGLSLLTIALTSLGVSAQERKYPPLSLYIMYREAEIPLAKSAALASISDHTTFKVFTTNGYEVVHQGDNGWVCFVMRGSTERRPLPRLSSGRQPPTIQTFIAPICLNPDAVKTVLRYYELRTKLAIEGKTHEEIAEEVRKACAKREIPKRDGISFAYMWSADQVLGPGGTGIRTSWSMPPTTRTPFSEAMLLWQSPSSDDADTPFAVVAIPVDGNLAIKAQP